MIENGHARSLPNRRCRLPHLKSAGSTLSVKRLDRAFYLDQQRIAAPIHSLARGHLHPALADAVFLDIGAFPAIETNADAAFKQSRDVMRAARVGREAVGDGWEGGLGCVVHAELFIVVSGSRVDDF